MSFKIVIDQPGERSEGTVSKHMSEMEIVPVRIL